MARLRRKSRRHPLLAAQTDQPLQRRPPPGRLDLRRRRTRRGGLQTQPIVVNGIVYGNTPTGQVIALDGATGKPVWSWDSKIQRPERPRHDVVVRRRRRAHLRRFRPLRLRARRQVPASRSPPSATHGRIDLHQDLDRDPEKQSVSLTSPGIIYKDLLIVGGRESEGLPASYGDIRAFDVRTGKLRWTFHTIPRPGEFGYDTWPKDAWTYTGAANNWSGMAIDLKRGIVYVPTGSAASDFYGANRTGDDLFANCLLALDAATGKRIWHFQVVKHDIWDRDLPSPPALVTVTHDGKTDRRRRPDHQARLRLLVRSRHRQAALPHRIPQVPGQHRRRRSHRRYPAAAHQTRALRPPAADRRHADEAHARGPPVGARAVQEHSAAMASSSPSASVRTP